MTYESTFTLLHMNSQWVFKGKEKMMTFQNKHCHYIYMYNFLYVIRTNSMVWTKRWKLIKNIDNYI